MGMFDEITCEYPLPETGYRVPFGHSGFQTKDLDNLMDRYTVSVDGRLIRHEVEYSWVEGEPGVSRGHLEKVDETPVDVEYHGDISFYDTFVVADGYRVWIQFKARFTEGNVSWIRVEDVRKMPQAKRVDIGGKEYPATEWGTGLDVIHLGEEVEIERDE
jgi:hypothetical protein